MLLIYPPAAKPSEPPAGITRLASALKVNRIPVTLWDANLEGFYWAIERENQKEQKNSGVLQKLAKKNIERLKDPETYRNHQKYRKAVKSLNDLINLKVKSSEYYSLGDFNSQTHSPLKTNDLAQYISDYENSFFTPFFKKKLKALVPDSSNLIGISLQFLNQALPVMGLIGLIRNEYPDCRIILGGGLITSWIRTGKDLGFLEKNGCTLVEGQGENKLVKWGISASLDKNKLFGNKQDFSQNQDSEHAFAKRKSDAIELHGLENKNYLSPSLILPVSFSSGCCYLKCTFCPEQAEKTPYINTRPEVMIPAVNEACQKYKPGLVHILDNEISPRYLAALSENPLLTPWYGFTRFYSLLLNPDFCRKLAGANCRMLKLGLESGSQEVLDALGKGQKIEETETILKNLKSAGIMTYIYLMFGTPVENREKAEETLNYCIRMADKIDFINCAIFNLPVSSHMYQQLETKEFYAGDLSLYSDFKHSEGWNRRDVRDWLQKRFKKHPVIKAILGRTPFIFNANHAAFFQYK